MRLLNDDEITDGLANVNGWQRVENFIEKKYVFKNFLRAMQFVNAVAFVAESLDHHPDILIHYNEVTLRNWTHVAGGITKRDFLLAEKIDQVTGL